MEWNRDEDGYGAARHQGAAFSHSDDERGLQALGERVTRRGGDDLALKPVVAFLGITPSTPRR